MLNEQKGNMYGFVSHTFNIIKGECRHNCQYCYMKRFSQKSLHFDEKELLTDLGENKVIFVGSSTDMFASDVQISWINRVLEHCNKYPKNTYLFQSKNPIRFLAYADKFPPNTILGTTIESNRELEDCKAPTPVERAEAMSKVADEIECIRMVTIEPIMDFDLPAMIHLIEQCQPDWVNIGADSNNQKNLPEPSKEKILQLIDELKRFTEIKKKTNIERLLK